jgi:hypothetical protein
MNYFFFFFRTQVFVFLRSVLCASLLLLAQTSSSQTIQFYTPANLPNNWCGQASSMCLGCPVYVEVINVPAVIGGTPVTNYQWNLNGTPIPGSNSLQVDFELGSTLGSSAAITVDLMNGGNILQTVSQFSISLSPLVNSQDTYLDICKSNLVTATLVAPFYPNQTYEWFDDIYPARGVLSTLNVFSLDDDYNAPNGVGFCESRVRVYYYKAKNTITNCEYVSAKYYVFLEENPQLISEQNGGNQPVKVNKLLYFGFRPGVLSNHLNGYGYNYQNSITGFPNYQNYQWIRDGFPIPNATSDEYRPMSGGDYTVTATSDCGNNPNTNTRSLSCSNLNLNSSTTLNATGNPYTFSLGATTLVSDYDVNDNLTIPAGATVTLDGGRFLIRNNCTKILVEAGSGNLPGGKLIIKNGGRIGACTDWKGIWVEGSSNSNRASAKEGVLEMTDAEIADAYIAVYAVNGGRVNITSTVFMNNENHVVIRDYATDVHGSVLSGNKFHVLRALAASCLNTEYALFQNNAHRKMVYIEGVYGVEIKENSFDGVAYSNTVVGGLKNAIQCYNVDPLTGGGYSVDIADNIINGDFAYGIWIKNSNKVFVNATQPANASFAIGNNYSNINTGVLLEGCSSAVVTGLVIGNATNGYVTNGVMMTDAFESSIQNSTIQGTTNGISWYGTPPQSHNFFKLNYLNANTNGIVIAPQSHPLCNPACNTSTNPMYIYAVCNTFVNNTRGIVGCGSLIDQHSGHVGADYNDWGNTFSASGNRIDFAWDGSLGTKPRIYYILNNLNTLNTNVSSLYSEHINGTNVTFGNFASQYISVNGVTVLTNDCGSLKNDIVSNYTDLNTFSNHFSIYPNPTSSNFDLICEDEKSSPFSFYVYNSCGSMVSQGIMNKSKIQIQSTLWSSGLYIICITDAMGNIEILKVVKNE